MQLLHTEFCTTALTIFLVTGLGNESLHHRLTFCPVIFVSKSCASKGCPNSPPLALLSLPTLMLDPLILSMLSVWAKWYEYGMNQARSHPPGHCIGKLGILLVPVAIYLTVSVLVLYKLGTSPLNAWLSCHSLGDAVPYNVGRIALFIYIQIARFFLHFLQCPICCCPDFIFHS